MDDVTGHFALACRTTDFEPHSGTIGGYKVWSLTDRINGIRSEFDGPYFTEIEAQIAADLWRKMPDRRYVRPQPSVHCSAWNPDPAREVAIRNDAMAARMILAGLIGATLPNPFEPRP